MTARGYELDDAVRRLQETVRKLDLKTARVRLVSGTNVTVDDTGGFFGGGPIDLETLLALIGAGTSPGAYLTVIGGGKGTVQAHGTLGATETIDLALGNYHWGTLDQDTTISTTGWTNGKDCQITLELIEDGTGGWVPNLIGVTWIGGAPTWDTTLGTTTVVALFSRDGGTTIYAGVIGGGAIVPPTPTGFLTNIYGEQAAVVTQAASGAAYAIDCSLGNTFDITLTANCTLSISNPAPAGVDSHIIVILRGNEAVTCPAKLTFYDPSTGLATTAPDFTTLDPDAQTPMEWASVDGGVSWGCELPLAFVTLGGFTAGGDLTGTSTSQTVAKINGSPLGSLASPVTADRLRWSGTAWVNSALIWRPVTAYDGTNWLPLVDGSGNAIMAEA